jgi:hypothetical protein
MLTIGGAFKSLTGVLPKSRALGVTKMPSSPIMN